MKTFIKLLLQRILGFENYLYVFSLFIIKKLRWDRNEKDFLFFLKLLPEKGIVLDIGANLGVMSFHLAKHLSRSRILAFEPIPYNYKNLEKIRNRYKLENLKSYQLALGEKRGELEMILPIEKRVRFHGLAHVKHDSIKEHSEGEVFNCKVEALDSFHAIINDNAPVTGIKIDVENFEYYVLKGAEKLISKHKPIIYSELWDNENRAKTIELLEHIGYKTMVLEGSGLLVFDPVKHSTQNFFFIPKSSDPA